MAAVRDKPPNRNGLTQGKVISYSSKVGSHILGQVENLPVIFQGPRLLLFCGCIISQALEPPQDALHLARKVGERDCGE